MYVTYEQICSVVQGVTRVEQKEDGMHFHRFTEAQEKQYDISEFHPKQYATAGVRLHFKTDSKSLYMKVLTSKATSNEFFTHDVKVDGELVGTLKNEKDTLYGEFKKTFELGEGIKDVCIYFPWSVCSVLQELILEDGSMIQPVKRNKKIIVFGDSITQGYMALNPSNRYAANLADALDAEEINKGIGGERFCPWLAKLKDDIEPDYISVAYGTNDWKHSTKEAFAELCKGFYENLVKNYPNVMTFAITPIWRKDYTEITCFKSFEEIENIIEDVTKQYDNVICISGRHFIPEDETLFSDLYLHPNDEGFKYYSESIINALLEKECGK